MILRWTAPDCPFGEAIYHSLQRPMHDNDWPSDRRQTGRAGLDPSLILPAVCQVLTAFPGGVAMVRPDATLVWANPEWRRLACAGPGEERITRICECFEEADRARLAATVFEVAAGVRSSGALAVGALTADGFSRPILLGVVRLDPVPDQGEPLVALTMTADPARCAVRRRDAAESAAMQRAQRYELLGRLAGSVAHDFNNLLTVVLGQAELIRFDLESQQDRRGLEGVHDAVANLLDAVDRASSMTRRLLTFARPLPPEAPADLDVGAALDDFGRILRRLVPERLELGVVIARGLPRVRIDRSRLEQILLNLVVNAVDACGVEGEVRIRASVEGNDFLLVVEDDGHGIPAEIRDRIFEPFFTTKGDGFGVGLATVREAVVEAGGSIRVRPVQPRGTRFEVALPIAPVGPVAPAARHPETVPMATPSTTRRLSILLCEDDEHVRRGLAESLSLDGHQVCETGDPTVALRFVADGAWDPDLVITDMVLPRLAGARLVARLREHKPRLPAILVTGYGDALEPMESHGDGPTVSLLKPVSLRALRDALANCDVAPR